MNMSIDPASNSSTPLPYTHLVKSDQELVYKYGSETVIKALDAMSGNMKTVVTPQHHQGRWSATAFGDRAILASASSITATMLMADWFSGSAAGVVLFVLLLFTLLMGVFTVLPIPMHRYPHLFHRGARALKRVDPQVRDVIKRARSSGTVHRLPELSEAVRVTAAADYLAMSPSWHSDMLSPVAAAMDHFDIRDEIISHLSEGMSIRLRAGSEYEITRDSDTYWSRMDRIRKSFGDITSRVDALERIASEVYLIDGHQRRLDALSDAEQLDREILDAGALTEIRSGSDPTITDRAEELESIRSAISQHAVVVSDQTRLL